MTGEPTQPIARCDGTTSKVAFRWALVGLTVFALVLRFWNLSEKTIGEDEAALWMEALGWNAWTSDSLLPRWATYFLMWLLHDTSYQTLHFLPALLGSLCVYVTGYLGEELGSKPLGLLSAALLAASPGAVFFSREARPYGFLMFGAAALYLCFFQAMRRKDRAGWVAYGITVALATCCHYVAGEIILAFAICLAIRALFLRSVKVLVSFSVSSLLGIVPAVSALTKHSLGVLEPQAKLSWPKFLARTLESLSPSFFSGPSVPAPVAWVTLFVALSSVPILILRQRGFQASILLISIFTGVTITYAYLGTKANFGYMATRYTIYLLIPLVVMIAASIIEFSRKSGVSLALCASLVIALNLFYQNRRVGAAETHFSKIVADLKQYPETKGIIVFGERVLAMFQYHYSDQTPLYFADEKGLFPTQQIRSRGNLRLLHVVNATGLLTPLLPGDYLILREGRVATENFCRNFLKGTMRPTRFKDVHVCRTSR